MERNHNFVKAEMDFLATPQTMEYSDLAYRFVSDVQAKCAADFSNYCASATNNNQFIFGSPEFLAPFEDTFHVTPMESFRRSLVSVQQSISDAFQNSFSQHLSRGNEHPDGLLSLPGVPAPPAPIMSHPDPFEPMNIQQFPVSNNVRIPSMLSPPIMSHPDPFEPTDVQQFPGLERNSAVVSNNVRIPSMLRGAPLRGIHMLGSPAPPLHKQEIISAANNRGLSSLFRVTHGSDSGSGSGSGSGSSGSSGSGSGSGSSSSDSESSSSESSGSGSGSHSHAWSFHHHASPKADDIYMGSLGYSNSGNMCMHQNFEFVSPPCQQAISTLYQQRAQFWEETMKTGHHNCAAMPFLLLFFMLSLCCSCCCCCYTRSKKNSSKSIQDALLIMETVKSNPQLKARVEAETGAPLPDFSSGDRHKKALQLFRCLIPASLCVLGAVAAVFLTQRIVAALSSVDENGNVQVMSPMAAFMLLLGIGLVSYLVTVLVMSLSKFLAGAHADTSGARAPAPDHTTSTEMVVPRARPVSAVSIQQPQVGPYINGAAQPMVMTYVPAVSAHPTSAIALI